MRECFLEYGDAVSQLLISSSRCIHPHGQGHVPRAREQPLHYSASELTYLTLVASHISWKQACQGRNHTSISLISAPSLDTTQHGCAHSDPKQHRNYTADQRVHKLGNIFNTNLRSALRPFAALTCIAPRSWASRQYRLGASRGIKVPLANIGLHELFD